MPHPLNHLFKTREIAALTLMTIHNLHFMVRLMEDYRAKIMRDEIQKFPSSSTVAT